MKKLISIIFAAFVIVVFSKCDYLKKNNEFTNLKGAYMGQTPPGIEPKIFLPSLLNNDTSGAFCTIFSPKGDEFYFLQYDTRNIDAPGLLSYMKQVDGKWTKPDVLHFTSGVDYDNDMCMSYDGKRLIFRSWRALPDGRKPDNHSYLWYVERNNEGWWGEAKPLLFDGEVIRTGYPSITKNNTLYFAHRQDGLLGIYRSEFTDNQYVKPEHVYTVNDTIETEGDMFVASDESYMIISCWDHPENIGSPVGDLYIVFKKDDGNWTEAINMGNEINIECGENCPTVTYDGKYLFFNRYCEKINKGNMYWMDAKIIEELKPDNLK